MWSFFFISMVKILTFIKIVPRGNGNSLCGKSEIIQERKKKFGAARSLQPIQKITLRFLYKMTACQNKFLLTVFAAYVIMQVQPTDILERTSLRLLDMLPQISMCGRYFLRLFWLSLCLWEPVQDPPEEVLK